MLEESGFTAISNNVCGVKAFFERGTARTPRSYFDSALVEGFIIDDEGSQCNLSGLLACPMFCTSEELV